MIENYEKLHQKNRDFSDLKFKDVYKYTVFQQIQKQKFFSAGSIHTIQENVALALTFCGDSHTSLSSKIFRGLKCPFIQTAECHKISYTNQHIKMLFHKFGLTPDLFDNFFVFRVATHIIDVSIYIYIFYNTIL